MIKIESQAGRSEDAFEFLLFNRDRAISSHIAAGTDRL